MSSSITLSDNTRVAHVRRILWTFGIGALLIAANPASADTFAITENQFTSSAAFDTAPTLGSEAFGDMVVYTSQALGPSGFENLVEGPAHFPTPMGILSRTVRK